MLSWHVRGHCITQLAHWRTTELTGGQPLPRGRQLGLQLPAERPEVRRLGAGEMPLLDEQRGRRPGIQPVVPDHGRGQRRGEHGKGLGQRDQFRRALRRIHIEAGPGFPPSREFPENFEQFSRRQ